MTFSNRILRILLSLFICFTSCNDDLSKETNLTFIGDSIIARWDLQSSFSSFITFNRGKSGARIEYIESAAGQLSSKNIVVMIGTNDIWHFIDDKDVEDYVSRYIQAIVNLNGEKVYLYSILPRRVASDRENIDSVIRNLNHKIEEEAKSLSNFVYIDVYDKFLDNDGKASFQYFNDGLHPSPEGYEILADALFSNI